MLYYSITFLDSSFINPVCAHAVFERSTDKDDTIHLELLIVRVICWNKVAWVSTTQKQELSVNNNHHLLFNVQTPYSCMRERERERERENL